MLEAGALHPLCVVFHPARYFKLKLAAAFNQTLVTLCKGGGGVSTFDPLLMCKWLFWMSRREKIVLMFLTATHLHVQAGGSWDSV